MIDTAQIEKAIEAGEFHLVYIPTISLSDGKCVGAETLIRWNHAGLDIPPDSFIPQCEGTPVIGSLTFWLLEQLSRELGDWLRQTSDVHISINISPDMLGRGGLMYAAKQTGLIDVADRMILEVTERGLADPQAIESLKRNNHGVKVALDDFGTGDANLMELSKLNADIIKLDKFFIDQIADENPPPKIIKGLIGLARGMEMKIIAEGVENKYQAVLLSDLGVEMAQGWFYSKPLRVNDFITFHQNHI